jgi:drug/metabolite transporter (DMT)-like permease
MAREHRRIKGTVLLVTASGCFCLAGILVRCASDIKPLKLAFFRFVVGLGLVVAAAASGRIKLQFNDKRLLFVRGLCGGTAIYIAFLAISKLGLGKGMLLICCFPIFACIISAIFLRERFGVLNMAAVLVALVGICFVSQDSERPFTLLRTFGKYEIITLIGAMISGVAVTTVRKLHDTDNAWSIYFAQCFVGMVLLAVPALMTVWDISWKGWLIMTGIGVGATAGQLLMTQGFRYVPVRIGSLIAMLDPVFAYAAGVLIFGERLAVATVFGAVLVIGSCCVVVGRRERPQCREDVR